MGQSRRFEVVGAWSGLAPETGPIAASQRTTRRARSRRNRALYSARKMSGHFARLNTNSSVTPAGVRGFVIFNSSSVIDVTIRR